MKVLLSLDIFVGFVVTRVTFVRYHTRQWTIWRYTNTH